MDFPFFLSPNFDWGYDVADYTPVDPDYGTLADADRLIAEAHKRGIRIILDLVLNHTSDQHEWFQQAKSSRDNPYRDWYVWRDKPNDWESLFGGSAWTLDEKTSQYYYHFFFPEQPDLNWHNPAVKMQDGKPPAIEQFKDGLGTWFYHAMRRQGKSHDEAFQVAADFFCRDRCRTPMQWSNGANGGFSPADATTWLPVSADAAQGVNVADQRADPDSMLTFFQKIAAMRQAHEALRCGGITLISDSSNVQAFWRHTPEQRILVALNMSAAVSELGLETAVTNRIYTNHPQHTWEGETTKLVLQPYEIWIGGV